MLRVNITRNVFALARSNPTRRAARSDGHLVSVDMAGLGPCEHSQGWMPSRLHVSTVGLLSDKRNWKAWRYDSAIIADETRMRYHFWVRHHASCLLSRPCTVRNPYKVQPSCRCLAAVIVFLLQAFATWRWKPSFPGEFWGRRASHQHMVRHVHGAMLQEYCANSPAESR